MLDQDCWRKIPMNLAQIYQSVLFQCLLTHHHSHNLFSPLGFLSSYGVQRRWYTWHRDPPLLPSARAPAASPLVGARHRPGTSLVRSYETSLSLLFHKTRVPYSSSI